MKINLKSKNYCQVIYQDQKKRDLLLILPGGGYEFTSEREAKPVADQFMELGLHAAIFYYREEKLLYPYVMDEAKELLEILKNDDLVDNISIIGFSAGGHYAGMLLTKYFDYFKKGLLIYPVISSHPKKIHQSSFENLLGKPYIGKEIDEVSIDKQVSKSVPPIFLMHSMDDEIVPVENSIDLMLALKKIDNYVELHLYPTGGHGISVDTYEVVFDGVDKDEFIDKYGYISSWVNLAKDFMRREM